MGIKRAYSEIGGAYSGRQTKVHLTTLQYMKNTNNMQPVYDKTLELLFRGANSKNNNLIPSVDHQRLSVEDVKKSCIKHTFIKTDGSLETGIIEMEHSPLQMCSLCKTQPSETHLQCGYCEGYRCSGCALHCSVCSSPTCENCSVNGYNNLSGIFCLSCCR